MKLHSWILSLIIAIGAIVAYPQVGMAQSTRENSEARKLWSEGNELLNDRNFVDAEKKFREALTKYPKSDQTDRSTYFLILTLGKLRRYQEAQTEIENFYRAFPGSLWREDVDEISLNLGGLNNSQLAQEAKIARERDESARRGSPALPPNASVDATLLGMLIQDNPTEGIAKIRERLRKDPADPAVVANIGMIFTSKSPQALPFLLELANSAASPTVRTVAFFYAMRLNRDRVQVANTLMEMLEKKENEPIVSEALFRMTFTEHREVLEKIVRSFNPSKFDAIGKIYRGGSITLRSDLLTEVAKLRTDPRAESFILDAAQNDKDLLVRQAAVAALKSLRSPADVKALENMLRVSPPRNSTVPPSAVPVPGSAPAPQREVPLPPEAPLKK